MATFKTLQAGSASHLRMTSELASAISGGLTIASVIVRMVHDMVRDAISDVIGKLASKVAIGALTAGLAAPWAVTSAITEVSSWVTRLSKEVADTVLSSRNLKKLLDKAETLFRRVGKKWESFKASRAKKAAKTTETAADDAKSAEHAADAAADGAKGADAAGDAADGARGADGSANGPSFNERHRPEVTQSIAVNKGDDLYPGERTPFARKSNITLEPNTHYRVERPGGVHSDYYTDASGNVTHVECHSKWETGYLNADLQNPLPNATYSVDGKFHYVTDEHARTTRMEVDGHMEPLAEGEKGVRSAHTQRKVKALGDDLPGEHNGGHGAGTQFHGPPEKINVVAMLKEVNQNFPNSNFESYLKLEQQIAKEPGNYKNFAVDFNYRDPAGPELTKTEQVPTDFDATWTDAEGVRQGLPFANQ